MEDTAQRLHWHCTLSDIDSADWLPLENFPLVYMGRYPFVDDVGYYVTNLRERVERCEYGCPGGWYRSRFALSVVEYLRTYTGYTFCSNPRLDRCDDPLVLEAVDTYEREYMRLLEYGVECRQRYGN